MLTLAPYQSTDLFLQLFPHRHDWIYASHPVGTNSPNWQSESRHQLSDRTIEQGTQLYGVRFGAETSYFLIDIDAGSVYHPKRDPLAIRRLLSALEVIGITDSIAITSSYSGGVHIYCPLPDQVLTWQLAAVVAQILKHQGFMSAPGTLEIFPNEKRGDEDEHRTLYNAHRLPLQTGSYLLSADWDLVYSSKEEFCRRWIHCTRRNSINKVSFDRLLKAGIEQTRIRRLSQPAHKFLNDLTLETSIGWTSYGQTNYLLGRIALREYIFGHYLNGGKPLTGEKLVMAVVKAATQSPGYTQWCRHQHEIWKRAEEWSRCVEESRRYYPYGKKDLQPPAPPSPAPPRTQTEWNQQQQNDARERLTYAIAVLLNNECLPSGTRERFEVLTQRFNFSGETLYHHRDLWHPDSLWKTPPHPPNRYEHSAVGCAWGTPTSEKVPSLLDQSGCNVRPAIDWEAFSRLLDEGKGCNTSLDKGCSDLGEDFCGKPPPIP